MVLLSWSRTLLSRLVTVTCTDGVGFGGFVEHASKLYMPYRTRISSEVDLDLFAGVLAAAGDFENDGNCDVDAVSHPATFLPNGKVLNKLRIRDFIAPLALSPSA